MFCENCGNPVTAETKFCKSCGAPQKSAQNSSSQPVQQAQPPQPAQPQQPSYTAPAPFQQYSSVDPNQPVYQKQVFHGKQFSTGSSGHVSFGGGAPKKKHGCLIVILIALALVVGLGVLVLVFGGSSDIANPTVASEIDLQTNMPITATNTFSPASPIVYCTFTANLDPGKIISVEWWYASNNELITTYNHTIFQDGEQVQVSLSRPTAGWPLGNYEIRMYVDNKHVVTRKFSVK
jgi:hypothetical protein